MRAWLLRRDLRQPEHRGLTNEIGEWAEGTTASGDFVATVDDHLVTAVRFLLVQRRISRRKDAQRQMDAAAMQTQLGRIKTALTRIATSSGVSARCGRLRTPWRRKARRFDRISEGRSPARGGRRQRIALTIGRA